MGELMQTPDWDIAIINGEPEQVVNAAMVRALTKDCPIGEVAGKAAFREKFGDEDYFKVWPEDRIAQM